MTFVYLILTVIVVLLVVMVYRRGRRNARRRELLSRPMSEEWKGILEKKSRPMSEEWKGILEKNMPLYNRFGEGLKRELEGLVNVFVSEKRFEGRLGQEITDEVKVTIAGQACVLLLNRKTRIFPRLRTIYVYPSTYTAKVGDSDGVVGREGRLGEAWQNGPVVLAWDSVRGGASNIHDGRNVVFHEFSHKLDQEDGSADGAPILESRGCYATWAKVLSGEYEVLQRKAKKFRRSVLRKYGAKNPAEFFAVATEAFLEKPRQMKKKHPELYDELKKYYKLDPVEWGKDGR
ncbi:MAG: M90 family metallopeptidase [Planctomycetota bacterium]|jgi:Mlc titration factor MtfA (ptsG expression regulator)